MAKLKLLFENIKIRLSDLFLLIGFIPMAIFLINSPLFMQHPDPNDVGLKIEIIIPLFLLLLISWGLYIFLERKTVNRTSRTVIICFVLLALIGIISIAIQPRIIDINFVATNGDLIHLKMEISDNHYVFFIVDLVSILIFIYIGIFLFPYRFHSILILRVVGYAVLLCCFALIIYSYCTEYEKYPLFLKVLESLDASLIKYYDVPMKSFIINSNAYGMMLMVGIVFCFINQLISKKWFYLPIALFFYVNMFFSFCRLCLFISFFIILAYIFYLLFSSYKKHKKRNLIIVIAILSLLISFSSILVINHLLDGAISKKLFILTSLLSDSKTISNREMIWNNTYKLLSSQNILITLFFGRGFGLINEMLLQANLASGFETQFVFPTHNSYLGLFAEGGLFFLFLYLFLLSYVIYVFIKCPKKEAPYFIVLCFGALIFVFYSLIETIHYLVYPFMFLIIATSNAIYCEHSKHN